MSKALHKHPGRGGNNISLAPLSPDQALAGLLKVKPEEIDKLDKLEKRAKQARIKRHK